MNDDTPRLQTRYELAQETLSHFREVWTQPEKYAFDPNAIAFYKLCRMAGIPFDYLDLSPEDYQSSERTQLRSALRFIKGIDYQWRSGGGLVFQGLNGSGKSFLSYMIAKAAVYSNIPTICLSLVEFIEKRRMERFQPNLILELIKQLEAGRVVIIDDFGKEYGGMSTWYGYEASTALHNVFREGGSKAIIVNTILTEEFNDKVSTTFLSKATGYEKVVFDSGEDFREPVNPLSLSRAQSEKTNHTHCWLKHPVFANQTIESLGECCDTCKYHFRPKLCLLRFTKQWIELEQK